MLRERDDQLVSPTTKAGCPIQARFWLEWDTTAPGAPFLSSGGSQGTCSATPRCRKSKPQNRMWLVRLLERLHLVLIQMDVQRLDCLIQMSHLARTDDRCAHPRLGQDPRQSYL